MSAAVRHYHRIAALILAACIRYSAVLRLPHCPACCPQLMAIGVPISFLAGAGICWAHLVYAWKAALKFKVLPEGVKPRTIHRFWTEFDVEVASRIGRVWDVERVLDQTALEVAENVLKVRAHWTGVASYIPQLQDRISSHHQIHRRLLDAEQLLCPACHKVAGS